jgi:subtilisin-like proprotein convertase family protein
MAGVPLLSGRRLRYTSRRMSRPASVLLAVSLLSGCASPPPPQGIIDTFTITPETIAPGQSAQLQWKAHHAETCTLRPDIGQVPAEGSWLVSPTSRTVYTLSCNGATTVRALGVLPAVRITSFTATPDQTIPDGAVTLSWTTEGAKTCDLSPGLGEVLPTGALVVNPTQATTYTLRCTGFGGPVTKDAPVAVVPVTSLDVPAEPRAVAGDGQLTLSWTQARGATNVYLAEAPGIEKATVESMPGGVVFRKVANPFTVTGLVNGRTYYFRVAAVSGALETDLSTEASGTPVDAPAVADPYFPQQWHLDGTEDIRAAAAWAGGVRGEGVKIAVVDEGVDLGHEDLKQNVSVGLSYDYVGNAPVRWAEHGTCVAGLAAARDQNGKGVRGSAPRAAIHSLNVLQDLTSSNEYDSMVRGKAYVQVSTNSWGDVDDGTGLVTESDPLWLQGVREGAETGRGGKGILYFWAAGNGGDSRYRDNANYDGQANRRFVFAISGYGKNGVFASYAEAGANVLVSAPTEGDDSIALTTTDITGAFGYNDGATAGEHPDANYTSKMNGTSASTPVAAGVGALILQARPELSYRDVRRVLAYSARKINPGDPEWTTNGAGLHINHKYGFGAVDAAAAVAVARTIVPAGPELSYASPVAAPALAIPDANATGVSSTLTLANTGVGHVEFVEVIPTLAHPRTGDLEIVLSHAGGASDFLHLSHECPPDAVTKQEVCSPIVEYPFGSVRHLDEPGDGDWTLTVRDRRSGAAGTLQSWKLVLYGRP